MEFMAYTTLSSYSSLESFCDNIKPIIYGTDCQRLIIRLCSLIQLTHPREGIQSRLSASLIIFVTINVGNCRKQSSFFTLPTASVKALSIRWQLNIKNASGAGSDTSGKGKRIVTVLEGK